MIRLTYGVQYCRQSSLEMSPAAGSAMTTPSIPVSFIARTYAVRKAVHLSRSKVTVSGSIYIAIISSDRSNRRPASEKGPMQPP